MNKTLSIVVLLALACAPATNVDLDDIELLVVAGNTQTVTPASSTTDVNGEVVANWTVGPNEGPNKLVVGWIRGENGFWVTSVDPPPLVPTAIQCFDIDTGT